MREEQAFPPSVFTFPPRALSCASLWHHFPSFSCFLFWGQDPVKNVL